MNVICEEFGSTKMAGTVQADLEDWLSESNWAPRTRKNYLVTLMTFFEPPLLEFLKDRHSGSGRLWPLSVDHYGDRLSQVAQKAEIQPWPHNALRHSFGSYFYALTKNENIVAAEMGNSPQMVFRHYRAVVKPADCAAFWAIRPAQGARSQSVSGESRVVISLLGGPHIG